MRRKLMVFVAMLALASSAFATCTGYGRWWVLVDSTFAFCSVCSTPPDTLQTCTDCTYEFQSGGVLPNQDGTQVTVLQCGSCELYC